MARLSAHSARDHQYDKRFYEGLVFNYNRYLRRREMPDPSFWAKGSRVRHDNKAVGMNRHIYRIVAAVLEGISDNYFK